MCWQADSLQYLCWHTPQECSRDVGLVWERGWLLTYCATSTAELKVGGCDMLHADSIWFMLLDETESLRQTVRTRFQCMADWSWRGVFMGNMWQIIRPWCSLAMILLVFGSGYLDVIAELGETAGLKVGTGGRGWIFACNWMVGTVAGCFRLCVLSVFAGWGLRRPNFCIRDIWCALQIHSVFHSGPILRRYGGGVRTSSATACEHDPVMY